METVCPRRVTPPSVGHLGRTVAAGDELACRLLRVHAAIVWGGVLGRRGC